MLRPSLIFNYHLLMHYLLEKYIYIYTCLFRHFWQSIKKRKNTIKYSGFVPYIHI